MQGTSEIKHRHPSTIGFRRQNYKQAEKRDFHFNVDKVLLFQFNFIHVFSIIRQEGGASPLFSKVLIKSLSKGGRPPLRPPPQLRLWLGVELECIILGYTTENPPKLDSTKRGHLKMHFFSNFFMMKK